MKNVTFQVGEIEGQQVHLEVEHYRDDVGILRTSCTLVLYHRGGRKTNVPVLPPIKARRSANLSDRPYSDDRVNVTKEDALFLFERNIRVLMDADLAVA